MTIDAKALLEGTTPGPWNFDGEPDNHIVWSSPEDRVCFLTSTGPTTANARLIAAAPDLARDNIRLTQELAELHRAIGEARRILLYPTNDEMDDNAKLTTVAVLAVNDLLFAAASEDTLPAAKARALLKDSTQ